MPKYTASYIVHIQYLGFRFHGWAKQVDVKTVHQYIDNTLSFVLGIGTFKTMGSSRTDAMVSASQFSFLLQTELPIAENFLEEFNRNLPADMRALHVENAPRGYNVLQPDKLKTYLYLFAHGEKSHPFCAPLLTTFLEPLNIALMQEGARCFEGEHNFVSYMTKPKKDTQIIRTVKTCQIVPNTFYTASFFPDQTWALKISSNGFARNQVRLIMAQLVELGRGNITIDTIKRSLVERAQIPFKTIAPASGLILHESN